MNDGTELWSQVVSAVPANELDRRANLGAETLDHVLIVWQGERRFELRPGDSATLAGGKLSYLRLESWIGYRVVYDPTESWLAAAIIVAVGSLVVFYGRRFRRPVPDRDGGALAPIERGVE